MRTEERGEARTGRGRKRDEERGRPTKTYRESPGPRVRETFQKLTHEILICFTQPSSI